MTLSLAASLGLAIVAEGVETPAQLRYLREQGCPVAQGYLLGRPAPIDDLETIVASGGVDLEALALPV